MSSDSQSPGENTRSILVRRVLGRSFVSSVVEVFAEKDSEIRETGGLMRSRSMVIRAGDTAVLKVRGKNYRPGSVVRPEQIIRIEEDQ